VFSSNLRAIEPSVVLMYSLTDFGKQRRYVLIKWTPRGIYSGHFRA